MIAGRLKILAESENVCALRGEILHGGENLRFFFAEAQHHTRFCRDVWMSLFGATEELQRALVERTFANLAVQPRDSFGVVVEDVWLDGQDGIKSIPVATEIGDQHFDFATRNAPANFFNGACENVGATIGLVVAIDAGDNSVTKTHTASRFGHANRLFFVRRADRSAGRHRAEATGARANVTQNHERGSAVFPAFADVGATCGFADGVEIESPHGALEVLIALAAKKFDLEPIGARVRVRRWDAWRGAVGDDVEG